jgi:transposase
MSKYDTIRIAGTKYDSRIKLNDEDKKAIIILAKEGYSQRKLARMFNCSRWLVQSILNPQPTRKASIKPQSSQYWAEAKRKYRKKKAELYNSGKLKCKPVTNKTSTKTPSTS